MPVTINGSGPVTGVTAITGAGLDLITTQTFSAVSSVSFNNCFTATYENYRIVVNAVGSTDGSSGVPIRFRFRSGGSDYTASTYAEFGIFVNASGGPSRFFNNSVTEVTVGWHQNYGGQSSFDLNNAAQTGVNKHLVGNSFGSGTADGYGGVNMARVLSTAAYDGFSIRPTAGTITGTIRVYGYRNS